jgi:MerR family transcriptional regulator, heat shock protein HspR
MWWHRICYPKGQILCGVYMSQPSLEILYSIGEAADVLGISIPTVRMYERQGLIIPMRRSSRHRRYTAGDLERIRCIRRMINEEKVSIEGVKRLLALLPCWKITGCPEDAQRTCSAFAAHNAPCWIQTRRSWKCKSSECRECRVYADFADCHTLKQTIASCFATPQQSVPELA